MHRLIVACSLLVLSASTAAASGRLVSGPMLGYVEHREALIWAEFANAERVAVEFWPAGNPGLVRRVEHVSPPATPAGTQPVKFVLPVLDMGTRYEYRLLIGATPVERPYPLTFTTQNQFEWRRPPDDFSFLVGSCAYINEPAYDRPGTPYGNDPAIFGPMARSGASLMIWLGDNIYLRESDWSSASGIWYRWSHDRALPELQPFLAAMAHHGIWDDHDYGPNNSNRSYPLKGVALEAFAAYHGNRTFGEPDNPGVYGTVQWQDALFILLDNRYHRDETELDPERYPDKSQLGRRQMEWLRSVLVGLNEGNNRRHATFRFLCFGGQFLTDITYPGAENGARYRREREEILELIRAHNIPGIVVLSGDVHYTELARYEGLAPYPLYEITSSSITAGSHTRPLQPSPARLADTVLQENNYVQVHVSGPLNDRVLRVVAHDRTGTARWTKEIRATELWSAARR